MTTLTGNIADVTGRAPDSISSITVKAPSARIGSGTDIIVTSPAKATLNKTTGSITISDLHAGLSWLYIEGDGWADSIPLAVAEGFQLILEAVANATGIPGIADYVSMLRSSGEHARLLARAALDGEFGDIVRAAQNAASTAEQAATSADVRATSAENTVDAYTPRVDALEAMAGLSPESPVDGQTANLVAQPDTLTRQALQTSFVSTDLTVSVADPRFGAVADWDGSTGTDNTSAIRAAISHARSLGAGAVLLYPQGSGLGYYVSETIEHGADLSVDMRVPIYHPGGDVTVRFGEVSKVTDNIAHYTVRVRRASQSDWTDPNDVGVEFINLARCKINIPIARGFTTNVRFIGDGQGFVVCTTTLGLILNGRCGIDLHSRNGGWVNSNLILGGYVLNHVGLNKGKPRCAVKYSSSNGFYNDGNIFDGLVAELKVDDAEGAEVEVIRAEYAQSNQHTNVRSETSGSVAIRNLNDSRFNNISLAYSQTTVGGEIDNSAAVRDTGHVTELRTLDRTSALRSVWRIDEMHKKAATYNGTTYIHIPGVSWRVSGSPTARRSMSGIEVQSEYIRVTADRAVGVFISTRDIKRLLLSAHTDPSSPGRWVIKAFNSSGESIEDESVVKRGAVVSFLKSTNFGGSWIASIGASEPVDFTVANEVDHVWVGLGGEPGNPALLTSIEVLTGEIKTTRAWQEWDDRGMNWGTELPTTGTYEAGRMIMNVEPSPGSPVGWICVSEGTPGTWVSLGDIPVS